MSSKGLKKCYSKKESKESMVLAYLDDVENFIDISNVSSLQKKLFKYGPENLSYKIIIYKNQITWLLSGYSHILNTEKNQLHMDQPFYWGLEKLTRPNFILQSNFYCAVQAVDNWHTFFPTLLHKQDVT